ncbi:MAG: heat-inducible transcriptional repressor HrcA [Nitrospirota bacterium]
MEFSERSRNILKAVVLRYIKTSFPVGSRSVTQNFGFGLSPATVRNIMVELENLGYLEQPHTSAGRIPTEKGFRFYVDDLIQETKNLKHIFFSEEYSIEKKEDISELLKETCRKLSIMSNYAAVVVSPKFSGAILKHIEFIRLRVRIILMVIVSDDGFIKKGIIEFEEDFTQDELEDISSYLNNRFVGLTLKEIKKEIFSQIKEEVVHYDSFLNNALKLGREAVNTTQENELFIEGTSNFLDFFDFSEIDKLKSFLKGIEERYFILNLLDRCIGAEGIQVFIGSENILPWVEDCSMVLCNYKRDNEPIGTLGIIGPMRMEYYRVIPLVDYTANILSEIITD